MKRFTVRRTYEPRGTRGVMVDEHGFHLCYTIERPATGEHPCIPEGTYIARRFDSHKHGPHIWQLQDVPGRDLIQFHIANWPHELLGCIAPGVRPRTSEDGEPGVYDSGVAYFKIMGQTADDDALEFTFVEDLKV